MLPGRPHVTYQAQMPVLPNVALTDSRVEPRPSQSAHHGNRLMFYLVLLYVLLEYGRPQDSVPQLAVLHLPAVVLVLIALLITATRKPKLSEKQTRLFLLFLGLMLLHVPIARNNHWAFHIGKGMFGTFVAYLGLVTSIDTLKRFRTLINVWLVTHAYLAISGILRQGVGIGGFLQDENDFGMTLNMVLPFSFFLALSATSGVTRVVYASLTGLFLVANMTTLSRGGFIGLVAVMVYCWLWSPRKATSALMAILLFVCVIPLAPGSYWTEMGTIADEGASEGTGEQRVYMWRIGLDMFLDNPLIGVGQGNFPFSIRPYEVASGLRGRSWAGHVAHSAYVTLAAELGLVGIGLFLMMLYHLRKHAAFTRKVARNGLLGSCRRQAQEVFHLSLAMGGSLSGFLVSGAFISVLYYPNFWLLLASVVALKNSAVDELQKAAPVVAEADRSARGTEGIGATRTHAGTHHVRGFAEHED